MSPYLSKELSYTSVSHFFWTDSRVVLGYIANESRRFHVFVANRIQTIRNSTEPSQWGHVQTDENPADLASRGTTVSALMESELWWSGPAFMRTADRLSNTELDTSLQPHDPEIRKSHTYVVNIDSQTSEAPTWNFLERLSRFSSWHRAKLAVAWCIRYVRILKERISQRSNLPRKPVLNPVSTCEL